MAEETRAKYERCKAIRGAHQSSVSKLTKEVDEILVTESLTKEQQSRIDVIHRQLGVKSSTLAELDKEASSLCNLEDIATEVEESETMVANIMACRGKIESVKFRNSHEVSSSIIPMDNVVSASGAQAHLPKLVLPTFKGDIT